MQLKLKMLKFILLILAFVAVCNAQRKCWGKRWALEKFGTSDYPEYKWDDCYHPCQLVYKLRGYTVLRDIEDCKFHKHCALVTASDGRKRCIIKDVSRVDFVKNRGLTMVVQNRPKTTQRSTTTDETTTTPPTTTTVATTTTTLSQSMQENEKTTSKSELPDKLEEKRNYEKKENEFNFSIKDDSEESESYYSEENKEEEEVGTEKMKTTTRKSSGGFEVLTALSNFFRRFNIHTRVVPT